MTNKTIKNSKTDLKNLIIDRLALRRILERELKNMYGLCNLKEKDFKLN